MTRRRRAITLTELLVALLVLLSVFALVLPAFARLLDERAFEHAIDSTTAHLLLARAHAQATGRPVEVMAGGERGALSARYFALGDEAAEPVPAGWARRGLPDGCRLEQTAARGGEGPEADEAPWRAAGLDTVPSAARMRLAVFLPDGSTLFAHEAWLIGAGGRRARIAIDPWTGLPAIERRDAGVAVDEAESTSAEPPSPPAPARPATADREKEAA